MNILNYNNKYKDRTPQDTMDIISQYFNSLGMTVETLMCQQTQSGTWCSGVVLTQNKIDIVRANGKGTSKDFCMASAYGELYERFCNRMFCINNYPLGNRIINESFNKFGYYFHPGEKEISFEECFNSKIGQAYLQGFKTNKVKIKELFDVALKNKYIGVPYKNPLNEQDIIYLDPRILTVLTGSSAMSAGNNFYEAYIQAISELYEHYVVGQHSVTKFDQYYYLNLDKVLNSTLKEIAEKIQEENDLYIIDFSYNFKVPVLMSLIVNHNTHTVTVNFGSAPTFDIAVERIFTELYQGRQEGFNYYKNNGQLPFYDDCDPRIRDLVYEGSATYPNSFPEFIFLNMTMVDSYNTEIFLAGEYSNQDLFNHTQKINELNNFKTYYCNMSGCKDMYAIKLFDINIPCTGLWIEGVAENTTAEDIDLSIEYFNMVNKYLDTQELDFQKLAILNSKLCTIPYEAETFFQFTMFALPMCWTRGLTFSSIDLSCLANALLFNPEYFTDMSKKITAAFQAHKPIYQELVKYTTILRYLQNQSYSSEEVINILLFLGIDCTVEDINNLYNGEYWVKKIVFADLNLAVSGYYNNYIQTMASYNREVLGE